MDLDLESLRCFEAVATTLNFRAAAARVALSPAALSERIRRLEAQVEVRLLDRTTRRVALTAPGERMLVHARSLLEAIGRTPEVLRVPRAEESLQLRLGTRFELGLSWLVPGLPALEAAAPGRTLHLQFGDGPELLGRLRRGDLDAVVTSARLTEGALEYAALHPERYVLVGSRRLVGKVPFRGPRDAPAHVLLDVGPDLPLARYFLDQAGGTAPWRFQRVEFLGTIAAVRLRLLQGVGVGVLPEYFLRADLARRSLVPLLPALRLPEDHFRLVWRRGHPRAPALLALAEDFRALPLR
jgi:DNA-binding transcriptional LysR family regulator